MKKKLLIIGSTGFFGKSILDYLDKIKEYDKSFSHIYLLSKTKKNILSNNLKRKFRFIQLTTSTGHYSTGSSGATFSVVLSGNAVSSVTVTNDGTDYYPNEVIEIPSSKFGGSSHNKC